MINRKLMFQRINAFKNAYNKIDANEGFPFIEKDEKVKFDDLFQSLSLFTKLAFEMLDHERSFLTEIEIEKLDGFINYLAEYFEVAGGKQYELAMSRKSRLALEKIYIHTSRLVNELDNIKPIVRGFHYQHSKKMNGQSHIEEINTLISKARSTQDSFISKMAILDERLDTVSQIIGTATAKLDNITKLQDNLDKVGSKYKKTLSILDIESESLSQKKNDLAAAHELLGNVRRTYEINDKSLKEFNKELSRLQSSVLTMESRATTIEEELDLKTKGIDLIMEQAKAALETSTTVSVGGFFKDQYDIAKKWVLIWPALAFLFLGGAIWICFDTLKNMSPGQSNVGAELPYLIARLCIVPLFLWGTWFCTNQYIKQKNITEDYAYKKVLSLSLIGFKSEIEKTGEANTTGFIKSLLKEILRSPLETLDKKHYKRETKLLKLAHDEMIANMFKNVKSKKSEPEEDKK